MSDLIALDAIELMRLPGIGNVTPHDLFDTLEPRIVLVDPCARTLSVVGSFCGAGYQYNRGCPQIRIWWITA